MQPIHALRTRGRRLRPYLHPLVYAAAASVARSIERQVAAGPRRRGGPVVERMEGRLMYAGDGLRADYFDNGDFTDKILTRVDATVNFDWGDGAALAGVGMGADNFSVRWSGQVSPEFSETYTFTTTADDGVRLWVDGQLVVNDWTTHAAADRSGTVALAAGQKYDLVLEYFEQGGGASAKLSWASPSRPRQVVPQSALFSDGSVAPPTDPGLGTGDGLAAEYFHNADLTDSALARVDKAVNFNWDLASPAVAIENDTFSARWTGQVQPTATAPYTFHTTTDDGARLWVDGQLIIDDWNSHAPTERYGTVNLEAGKKYDIRFEYFENDGGASAVLEWSAPGQPRTVVPTSQLYSTGGVVVAPPPTGLEGDGLKGEYFNNTDFTAPVLTRTDARVDFDWQNGSPDPNVGADTFAVRWTGQVLPRYTETYTFATVGDDGTRLWVDGKLLVDDWTTHGPAERSGQIALEGGRRYDIKVEYFEQGGGAVARLKWSSPSQAYETIPQSRLYSTVGVGTSPNRGILSLGGGQYTVSESGGQLIIPVLRTGGTDGTATVDYTTVDGTALAGFDYVPTQGVLTIPDGADRGVIVVPLIDDLLAEGNETFSVSLNGVTGAGLNEPRTALVTIADDESASPFLTFNPSAFTGYSNQDAPFARADVSADGRGVTLRGNAWKKTPLSYAVTGRTIVEFEFRADEPKAEMQGIGLDDDDNHDNAKRMFRVAGKDGWSGGIEAAAVRSTDVGGGWRKLSLKYSDLVSGFTPYTAKYLAFFSDHDAVSGDDLTKYASAGFRNVRVYEDPNAAPPTPTTGQFSLVPVVTGLSEPTAIDFAAGDRMFVAQKDGVVKLRRNGQMLATPFVDLRDVVNNVRDRGLLGLAVHPQFPLVPYVYVAYTYDPPETAGKSGLAGPDGKGNRAARVERIEADPATDYATAKAGGRTVILGKNSTWANISRPDGNSTNDGSIPASGRKSDGSWVPDFIPTDSESHSIGGLAFGLDGSLFVAVGDGASYGIVDKRATRVQDLDSLSGKLLRIDAMTGRGLADNPFYDGDATADRSKVYALGLRNPFRLTVNPATGEPFVGDVGWTAWEEINTGRGANFGWPFYEGGTTGNVRTSGYKDLPEATSFYAAHPASGGSIAAPLYARSHAAGARAVIAGAFYTGTLYPTAYRGAMFFSDYGQNAVQALILASGTAVDRVETLTGSSGQIVEMSMGPDGHLYVVNLLGDVKRLDYV